MTAADEPQFRAPAFHTGGGPTGRGDSHSCQRVAACKHPYNQIFRFRIHPPLYAEFNGVFGRFDVATAFAHQNFTMRFALQGKLIRNVCHQDTS